MLQGGIFYSKDYLSLLASIGGLQQYLGSDFGIPHGSLKGWKFFVLPGIQCGIRMVVVQCGRFVRELDKFEI